MCLILFGKNADPNFEFVLAANRDEFLERPTASLEFWQDNPNIISGLDLKAGGTWLGMHKNGKMAAITNYREPASIKPNAPSRGALTRSYLENTQSAEEYLHALQSRAHLYNGFNLLLKDDVGVFHYSNVSDIITPVKDGIHGLSNHLLDTPWPKVQKGKKELDTLTKGNNMDDEQLFQLLYDSDFADNNDLPDTGIPQELEQKLSAKFIKMPEYGTRCSSIIKISRNKSVHFTERTFDTNGQPIQTKTFEWSLNAPI